MKCSFFPSSRSSAKADEKEQFFLRNGSKLLEQLISLCHGNHNPIRTFSAKDLKEATNNYNPALEFHDSQWYKGSLEGRPVSVWKFDGADPSPEGVQLAVRDIAMTIKMSNHRSALKLLGCCLETPVPTIVYEFPSMEGLADRLIIPDTKGTHSQALTWKIRLKIAFEIAHFISYLHTAFPRPIIHRDIKLTNIFLDELFVPKLFDFLLSVVLPEGETYVEDGVKGTLGYLAPEYFRASIFTEKIDVYAFGVILIQILTGQRACTPESDSIVSYANRHVRIHGIQGINGIVDPKILEEGSAGILQLQQFQAVFRLAARCTKEKAEKRPTSTEVAKQLRRIQRGMLGVFEDGDDFVPNLAQFFEAAA